MLEVEWTGAKGDFLGAVLFYDVDNKDGIAEFSHFDMILAEKPDIESEKWDEQQNENPSFDLELLPVFELLF